MYKAQLTISQCFEFCQESNFSWNVAREAIMIFKWIKVKNALANETVQSLDEWRTVWLTEFQNLEVCHQSNLTRSSTSQISTIFKMSWQTADNRPIQWDLSYKWEYQNLMWRDLQRSRKLTFVNKPISVGRVPVTSAQARGKWSKRCTLSITWCKYLLMAEWKQHKE